jgi:hypothetical protein
MKVSSANVHGRPSFSRDQSLITMSKRYNVMSSLYDLMNENRSTTKTRKDNLEVERQFKETSSTGSPDRIIGEIIKRRFTLCSSLKTWKRDESTSILGSSYSASGTYVALLLTTAFPRRTFFTHNRTSLSDQLLTDAYSNGIVLVQHSTIILDLVHLLRSYRRSTRYSYAVTRLTVIGDCCSYSLTGRSRGEDRRAIELWGFVLYTTHLLVSNRPILRVRHCCRWNVIIKWSWSLWMCLSVLHQTTGSVSHILLIVPGLLNVFIQMVLWFV